MIHFLKYFGAIVLTVLWLFCLEASSLGGQYVTFWVGTGCVLFIYRERFTHPLGVVSIFYALYSTSYLGHLIISDADSFLEEAGYAVFLHGLGYGVFFLTCYFFDCFDRDCQSIRKQSLEYRQRFFSAKSHGGALFSLKLLLLSSFSLSTFYVYGVLDSGATSKRELVDSSGLLEVLSYYTLMFFSVWYLLFFMTKYQKNGRLDIWCGGVFLYAIIVYLLSGERDVLFRFLFYFIIFCFDFKFKFRFVYYLLIVFSLFFVLPISQFYKAAFISEGVTLFHFDVERLFVGEFISSGRNLSKILQAEVEIFGFFEVVVSDFLRFLNADYEGVKAQSTSNWFNKEYLPSIGLNPNSGWGFSWVGFWYLAGGGVGVILGMFVSGFLLIKTYALRLNGPIAYTTYLCLLAVFLYVQRGDLANFLGGFIKFSLVPILLYVVFRWAFSVRVRKLIF